MRDLYVCLMYVLCMFYVCFRFDEADRKQDFFKFVRWKFDFFLSLFDGSSIGDEDTTKQYHFIGAKKMITNFIL